MATLIAWLLSGAGKIPSHLAKYSAASNTSVWVSADGVPVEIKPGENKLQ